MPHSHTYIQLHPPPPQYYTIVGVRFYIVSPK